MTLICVVCQKVLLDVLIGSDRTSQNTQITLYFLIVKVLILIPRRLFALVMVLSFYFRIQHNFDEALHPHLFASDLSFCYAFRYQLLSQF